MVGAVHVGIMAACVVLFVPMGMAGYHLSRNKMLFFSGALFITLAVGVHLTPYFPSISQFLNSSSSSIPTIASPRSCLTFLHLITWNNHGADQNRSSTVRSWDWERSSQPLACGFQKLKGADASELLNGSWVFVAGDSQARLFVLALLELVLDEKRMAEVEGDLFKRHSDYRILIEESGIKVDFVWAPYMENLTHAVEELGRDRRYPDVLILGCGLWHMLHFGNAIDYGGSLMTLKQSIGNTFPNSEDFFTVTRNVHMYWLGMPTLVNSLLNTEEKKEKMTTLVWEAYDREVSSSRILYDSSGSFVLLDVALLSQKCGLNCTSDGMHYDDAVYQAALQVMLNALLVESQQKIR